MNALKLRHYQFKLSFVVLTLFFVILFCVCGVWQLHRYHFKKTLFENYQVHLKASPREFSTIDQKNNLAPFEKILLTGHYLNELTFYIQNKIHQSQIGYEVLTPFKIENEKKLLLIDRGWVPQTKDHSPPAIEPVKNKQTLSGYVYLNHEYQYIMGNNIIAPHALPLVLQKIDIPELSQVTHQFYFPFIVRLEPSNAHGFVRDWPLSTLLPERHLGYAIQWFAMAVVLLIAFLIFSYERPRPCH